MRRSLWMHQAGSSAVVLLTGRTKEATSSKAVTASGVTSALGLWPLG
jgi:hypothetical protein